MTQFKNAAVKSMVVMRKAFRTIDAKVSESFREFGLTPTHFVVLDVLFAKWGAMKIGELIDSMLATSGNMTVVIKNMEKNGWVTRMTCPTDKRAYLVTLTEAGRDLIQKALPKDSFLIVLDETGKKFSSKHLNYIPGLEARNSLTFEALKGHKLISHIMLQVVFFGSIQSAFKTNEFFICIRFKIFNRFQLQNYIKT